MRKRAIAASLAVALAACTTTKDGGAKNDGIAESQAPAASNAPTEAPPAAAPTTAAEAAAPRQVPTASDPAETSPPTDPPTTQAPPQSIEPIVDPRAPGVSDTSIKIGIAFLDLSKIGPIIGINHGDYQKSYQAIIDDLNAKGGINGRTIDPVFVAVDPANGDTATAACTKLTEDEKVFAVLGFAQNDEALCYVDTGETPFIGGAQTAERMAKAKVLWLGTDASDNMTVSGFQRLIDLGEIKGKVGIVGVQGDEALYDASVKPALAAAGIDPGDDVAYIDTSSGDPNQTLAVTKPIMERFKADGVTQVMMISQGASGTFPTALKGVAYRPQLVFSDLGGASTYPRGHADDLSMIDGAIVAGTYNGNENFKTLGSPSKECLEVISKALGIEFKLPSEVPKGDPDNIVSALGACRAMGILTAALRAAGKDLNLGTLATGAYSMGPTAVPGTPDPLTFGPGVAADGDPELYVYRWNADRQGFDLDNG